jgi:hypothetical protein
MGQDGRTMLPSTYDAARGEFDLHRFVESSVDDHVRTFLASWTGLRPEERNSIRRRLTEDEMATLWNFARRCALTTFRRHDPAVAAEGVIALTAIDANRFDWRDVHTAACLLSHALISEGADATQVLTEGADRSESRVAEILRVYASKPFGKLSDCAYRRVETEAGPVFFDDWGAEYRPTIDLTKVALEIAADLEADLYRVSSLTAGADVPDVWFRAGDPRTVEDALASVTGCISIDAELRPDVHPTAPDQQFTVFLAETTAPEYAEAIAAASGGAAAPTHEALALAAGVLCCVAIARSFVEGVASFEQPAALERFRPRFAAVLANAQPN